MGLVEYCSSDDESEHVMTQPEETNLKLPKPNLNIKNNSAIKLLKIRSAASDKINLNPSLVDKLFQKSVPDKQPNPVNCDIGPSEATSSNSLLRLLPPVNKHGDDPKTHMTESHVDITTTNSVNDSSDDLDTEYKDPPAQETQFSFNFTYLDDKIDKVEDEEFCPSGTPKEALKIPNDDVFGSESVSDYFSLNKFEKGPEVSQEIVPAVGCEKQVDENFTRAFGRNLLAQNINVIDVVGGGGDFERQSMINLTTSDPPKIHSKRRRMEVAGLFDKNITSTERHKHQVTYLAQQAMERETEVRSESLHAKVLRKEAKSRYGF